MSRARYRTAHRVDRDRSRERMTPQEAVEAIPTHPAASTATGQPSLPEPGRCRPESPQCVRIAGNPIVGEVATELLAECPVLVHHRLVTVDPAPLRERL